MCFVDGIYNAVLRDRAAADPARRTGLARKRRPPSGRRGCAADGPTFDLKHEKAAGDRGPVQAAERSFVERTAPRKEEPTEEQKDARAAARRAKKARQKANKAEKKAAAAAASEAEHADYPHAQLRENIEFVMNGLEAATQAARNPTGSNIQVAYSLPPEGGSGFGDLV
ncbi:hypothetical protein EMIHUDRAFT_243930 [Emiliania huxleyi CCMP1516]|uniref:Uncharacterized protein n=2 Tax=Emiliania huxleyi TaxID=2903 RepID=A0A0D3J292_EMIH1|nr:hypothetical protein EMIHUDRAFT_243930 [Emiliania huxleyi CCMP1516]EOD17627.1 hypothetical protein EMIHUDRAFT_243930 [Emiliania huxleyi CCMP1516]|eukprot:XP_005770056.1 hypothetical protein EMIHUDRAFT_243930 [Emiliania huxleyi CCMP1516]